MNAGVDGAFHFVAGLVIALTPRPFPLILGEGPG